VKALPTRVFGRFTWWPRDRWGLVAEVEQRNLPGFIPRASATLIHGWGPRSRVALSVAHGGFGGWRPGAAYMRAIKPGVVLQAELPNLTGMLSGRAHGLAIGLGVSLSW